MLRAASLIIAPRREPFPGLVEMSDTASTDSARRTYLRHRFGASFDNGRQRCVCRSIAAAGCLRQLRVSLAEC
jgi:hypothetical protein